MKIDKKEFDNYISVLENLEYYLIKANEQMEKGIKIVRKWDDLSPSISLKEELKIGDMEKRIRYQINKINR